MTIWETMSAIKRVTGTSIENFHAEFRDHGQGRVPLDAGTGRPKSQRGRPQASTHEVEECCRAAAVAGLRSWRQDELREEIFAFVVLRRMLNRREIEKELSSSSG
jgi:hypothetical protein